MIISKHLAILWRWIGDLTYSLQQEVKPLGQEGKPKKMPTFVFSPNPAPQWLSDNSWSLINQLNELPKFTGIAKHFEANHDKWKVYFDSSSPHATTLPDDWNQKLNIFQRMLLLRCLRPDKLPTGIQQFITANLGR
jgi:hypothetical protein